MSEYLARPEVEIDQENGLVYVRIREGKVAKTTDLVANEVWADWDEDGKLLRIEVL